MKSDIDQSTIQLTQGNLFSLPNAQGSTVAVLWGSVWLTQDGIQRDYELNAGESFTIHAKGKAVISAFENSALTILQPCAQVVYAPSMASGHAAESTSPSNNSVDHRDQYLSSEELDHFKREALEMRDIYIASLIFSLGCVLRRGLGEFADVAATIWLKNARRQWANPRDRLYWS